MSSLPMQKPLHQPSNDISSLVQNLRRLKFTELLGAWDALDSRGSDLSVVRRLALDDRYYLLIKLLHAHYAWHPWIYDRCREVEAHPDGYIDIWGRDHFKSSLITFAGAIQEILRNAEICIGIFSHTKGIAAKFVAQIKREFEDNELLKRVFSDILWANPARESPVWTAEALIVRRASNPREATLEGHGLVDGQPTSRHFDLLIYDDVVTEESVNTTDQINKTTKAWELSDNLGRANARKWHTGTRYHYADTYSEIIKRGGAMLRHRPATHDGTIDGNPVLLTRAQWRAKFIAQGEATLACQLLGNPLAGHQRMFNVEDVQVYEVRPETLMCYLMVDPARSVKKESANTAMVVIGVDYAGNKYLLDGIDKRLDLQDRWNHMRDLWRRWKAAPGVQGIEVGYERFGAIADLDYFKERQKIEQGVSFEITELEWPREGPGSKIDRVQRLGPDIRSHRFYVPYATKEDALTRVQRSMVEQGYAYRIARQIRKRDEDDVIYDVTERLKAQISFFPFGGKVDLVDAVSRIYDMEPRAPVIIDQHNLDPEYT